MSSKSFSDIKRHAYTYLGYRNLCDSSLDGLIDECLKEIEDIAQFNYVYVEYNEYLDFIKNNQVYVDFLHDSKSYYLVLTTLGKRVDDRTRYYSMVDMTKGLVFDCCSSAYLEYMADEYEENNFIKPHTFRFCPGYSNTSIDDIREIAKVLNFNSLGVRILDSGLMVPLKTMCGIVGIGGKNTKTCDGCVVYDKCQFRKEGLKCYERS